VRWPLRDRLFGIDPRALAWFRICIGGIVLVDLFDRAADLERHYTDAGVLPRADLARLFGFSRWYWSLHLLSGSVAGQAALFGAAAAAALALTIGYRTRLATVVTWLLLASLQARNPMLLYGGDHLLRLLLFWSIFLPLGSCWSVDRARLGGSADGRTRHCSAASAAILLQMSSMYFFSGLLKQNQDWQSGEALSHVLSFDMYVKPWAESLRQYPDLLRHLSRAIPWLEIVLALLLFAPWRTARLRGVALVLLAGFHLTIESLLSTGLFQYVALTGLTLFLPTAFWNRLPGAVELGPGARPPSRRGGRWLAYAAVQLLVLALFAYVLVWNVAGLGLEQYWARERLSFAQEIFRRGESKPLPILPRDAIVERRLGGLGAVGRVAGLYQRWDMFYRAGDFLGGWPVFVGTLRDGSRISLLEGGIPFQGDAHPKPPRILALYPNARWLAYLTDLRAPGMQAARELLAGVVGRDWNRRHPELAIDRLEMLFVQDRQDVAPGAGRQTTVWFDGSVSPD
jgi:hypothetical protein